MAGSLLGRGLLGGLLGGCRGLLGLLRQLDADQLGGALAHRAGLRGHVAQRLLGQLDGLVRVALDAAGGLFESRLAAQPLEGGLATLDELVVRALCGLGVALGELAQLVGGQPLTQVAELGRQLFLQLGDAGAGLLDARLGVGAGLAGTLTQGRDDLVDPLEGQIGGADRGKQRGLQVVSGRLVLGMVVFFAMLMFPFSDVRLTLMNF